MIVASIAFEFLSVYSSTVSPRAVLPNTCFLAFAAELASGPSPKIIQTMVPNNTVTVRLRISTVEAPFSGWLLPDIYGCPDLFWNLCCGSSARLCGLPGTTLAGARATDLPLLLPRAGEGADPGH